MSDSETPWTVALQASLSMGFPRQEYWSGLPFPPPGQRNGGRGYSVHGAVFPTMTDSDLGELETVALAHWLKRVSMQREGERREGWWTVCTQGSELFVQPTFVDNSTPKQHKMHSA